MSISTKKTVKNALLDQSEFDTVLKPKYGLFNFNFKDVAKYKDLVFLFVKRDFVSRYKQTILGPAWAIIQPLFTTVIFTLVFGNIANLTPMGDGIMIPTFVFYLIANVMWTYFSGTFNTISTTFISNSGIFGKVYFPRLVLPISNALTNLISFSIQFVFFLCFWGYYLIAGGTTIQPQWQIALVPLLLIQSGLLAVGTGVIISALTTKYRDLIMLVSFGVQLWMYITPVAYSMTTLSEKGITFSRFQIILWLNPMTPIVETVRFAFLGPDAAVYRPDFLLISVAVTFVFLIIGVLMFNKVEKTFMDTV